MKNHTTCDSHRRAWDLLKGQLFIMLVLYKLLLVISQLVLLV